MSFLAEIALCLARLIRMEMLHFGLGNPKATQTRIFTSRKYRAIIAIITIRTDGKLLGSFDFQDSKTSTLTSRTNVTTLMISRQTGTVLLYPIPLSRSYVSASGEKEGVTQKTR